MADRKHERELARLRAEPPAGQGSARAHPGADLARGAQRIGGRSLLRAFHAFRCLPFDVGVAVMVEQNRDLYVTSRQDAESLISDAAVRASSGAALRP